MYISNLHANRKPVVTKFGLGADFVGNGIINYDKFYFNPKDLYCVEGQILAFITLIHFCNAMYTVTNSY